MMRSHCFTILHDADDLARLEALCPEALSGTVLGFALDIHLQLQERGIDHLTPMDLIDYDELPRLQRFEASVQQFWAAHARVVYRGVDLLALARIRHISCLRRVSWAAYVIQRALEVIRPEQVVVFEEPAGHGLDQPPGYRKMPLLFSLLRGIAEQAGCPVHLLRSDGGGRGAFEDRAAHNARKVLPPGVPDSPPFRRPWILVHGNGSDLLRQVPLIQGLLDQSHFAVVQSYSSASEPQLQQLSDVGHHLCHVSQLTSHDPATDVDTAAGLGRARFDEAALRAPAELNGIFRNPYMKIHFDFIFTDYARSMAQHLRSWRRFFSVHRPSALVSTFPTPMTDIASQCGIPCLNLPHGLMMLGLPEFFTSLHGGCVGAISSVHRDRLVSAGLHPRRVRVTGDPYLDPILDRIRLSSARSRARSAAAVRRRYSVPPESRFLLLLSGGMDMASSGATLPMIDWAHAVHAAGQLATMIERHPQWRFVVKCHPRRDHPRLYERLNEQLPCGHRLAMAHDTSLHDLAPAADAIVSFNISTSGVIESSLWGTPVIFLDTSMMWFDHEQWATDSWPRVNSVDELEEALEAMFSDAGTYEEYVNRTQDAVHRFFDGPPQPAVPRCLETIDQLVLSPAVTST